MQHVTAALRIRAYRIEADAVDEYKRTSESSALLSFKEFGRAVVELFGTEYLRAPNGADMLRIPRINAKRGFRGRAGSIDWQHCEW